METPAGKHLGRCTREMTAALTGTRLRSIANLLKRLEFIRPQLSSTERYAMPWTRRHLLGLEDLSAEELLLLLSSLLLLLVFVSLLSLRKKWLLPLLLLLLLLLPK